MRNLLLEKIGKLEQRELWSSDVQLGDVLPATVKAPPAADARGILVTGATGFIGAFLVKEMLEGSGRPVCCLVRARSEADAKARLHAAFTQYGIPLDLNHPGLTVQLGDIAAPHLGLAEATWRELQASCGTVIHAAAAVNFHFNYNDVRGPNVMGVRELIRFCGEGTSRTLHFLSTLGAFLHPRFCGARVTESQPIVPEGSPGYIQSKWVCEQLITAAAERGLRTVIYRAPWVSWHSVTGAFNRKDFVCRFLASVVEHGMVPRIPLHFPLAPVDWVCRALRTISEKPAAYGKTIHLCLDKPVALSEFESVLRALGHRLAELDYSVWRERVASSEDDSPLRQFLPSLPESLSRKDAFLLPALMEPPLIERSHLVSLLGESAKVTLDPEYLQRFFRRRPDWKSV